MSVVQITYDLSKPETSADYKRLIDKIKSYGIWAKALYSHWFVVTTKPASIVRDELKPYIDANDTLLVVNVTDDWWASYGLPADVAAWLKKHL